MVPGRRIMRHDVHLLVSQPDGSVLATDNPEAVRAAADGLMQWPHRLVGPAQLEQDGAIEWAEQCQIELDTAREDGGEGGDHRELARRLAIARSREAHAKRCLYLLAKGIDPYPPSGADHNSIVYVMQGYQSMSHEEREIFAEHCDTDIGQCTACRRLAPLTDCPGGSFCAWGCVDADL